MSLPRFVGAKRAEGVWQRILSEMPRHSVWVEAFAGTGWLTQQKLPASSAAIVIDADPAAPALTMEAPAATRICGDARAILPTLPIASDWLVYLDPPYLASTRLGSTRRIYRCELFSDEEHAGLLALARSLPCYVMLSGYWSQLYADGLPGWRLVRIPTIDRRRNRREECLWLNFPDTAPRHDSRFAGHTFRERERIKRKAARWRANFLKMPAHERAAVLAALGDSGSARQS